MMEEAHFQDDDDFAKLIFSWSLLDHILNHDLFIHQVENIPLTFQSAEHYLGSFRKPLLEETRAELASSLEIMHRAPFAEVCSFSEAQNDEKVFYDVTVGSWRKRFSEYGKEPYQTLPGDLLILADGKPESVSDLHNVGRTWALLLVENLADDGNESDNTSMQFKVKASKKIEFQDGMFVVFLMNITTQRRIWSSLHMNGNLDIIKEVLYPDSMVKENCTSCSFDSDRLFSQNPTPLDKLNESQRQAVMASLYKTECCHNSYVEQIWGPPGTGKTTTVSVLLLILLQMNRRTLTCAPTNVAILHAASRVLSLVKESFKTTLASGDSFCSTGDMLLFGSKERLKVGAEIEEIYLEHRVKRLTECLGSFTGWKHCMSSMTDLLENCVSQYYVFVETELSKENKHANEDQNKSKTNKVQVKSFIEFVQDWFSSSVLPLRRCILTFLTHIPRSFMKDYNFHSMIYLLDNLTLFESLLFGETLVSEELEHLFTSKPFPNELSDMSSINSVRSMSISVLRALQISLEALGLPGVLNRSAIIDFCFERASLIFCTTSNSYKLHTVEMKPLNILVIDEASQLTEAESTVPLQLPGLKHAILIGDECQLPAMVTSNVCSEYSFGRSLFGRLSSLGHSKHLLNVQYRMHPSISFFPNWKFYQNQILDAENVLCKSYEKRYLSGPMFGSYSFINVVGGREEKDEDGQSRRNMVEVAIVIKIVKNLFKAWFDSKKKLTIGVISPYAAQVALIQEKLGQKYDKLDGFSIKVKSVDGFQGGEEDIIILSTVRSNSNGSVGFISSPQRTNVALTRARHCLWILGNERTLTDSESTWKELVCDARNRHCLFDADADECLKMTVINTLKELEQLDDLVSQDSVLFKHAKWKVLFSNDFRRSFGRLASARLKKLVLNLLLRLSDGWRPKNRSVDLYCEKSSHILKQFKVGGLYAICTIDVIKESKYVQVLKVWDILPFEDIPKLTKRLESIFAAYTDDYISRCTVKCVEGNLVVPKSWPASQEVTRFCHLSKSDGESEVSDGRSYIENSKVSESLLLMKFYSLSDVVVKHLLSGNELDLPMQVSDEQMDIILSSKSSFIIGRSGTGKTTTLTMKLFRNEQFFHNATEGTYEAESSGIRDSVERKPTVLRQLFVTLSPRLCHAVKQHVSYFTRVSSNGSSSADINLDYVDVTSAFNDIPDTFINVPVKNYPLFITFRKFLMMLDGTLGNSFFERFLEARESFHGNHISSRSIAVQTFIRLREVTFERFCSFYWPHFNSSLTKKLDPSRLFTEIISHIKGGLQAGQCSDGKLSCDGYSLLAECRSSILTKQKRETVYNLFQAYEKMKTERGEFDLGDLVNDIHHRLKNGHYTGDKMDFVYIDEVQDFSMGQISLFKYMCKNVDEGFVFAGDTAQTIARGIDFRFQDIRSLFYKEFLTTRKSGKQGKGLVSEIFQLKQNFRTHAGVLDLAQSVIDILYCYFVHSIDILKPETSLISGETPVLLESGNGENAIATIFGSNGSSGERVGFGAEQVILVRDDCAKIEVCKYVGKHALVLTIVECKGLEFQDVLLYNFFGTSPLKNQWRVIYGYMKERDWLDEKLPQSFPTFSEARHSVLCSELKKLYVAITRTRQRLWICENEEELSKPMFDYWKRKGLVQIRKLDDSVAQAMQVSSSPQEWWERGKKLFYENNFVMATMCFERAGKTVWEKLAKASGLRASADQMRVTNPEAYLGYLREAAGMFESIEKLESAASCYCDLGEYERAGKIYLYKCGKIDAAAECFILAGCYSDAAEAYAKGHQFSNCLSACKNGKLFDKGMQYIEYWKEHVDVKSKELEQIEQEFLENCAFEYHEHKDPKSMMKFVRAFCSMESKRVFLRSLGCLDDLLLLEEESGLFLDAVELARSRGDVIKEADLLEKAGQFKEATVLLLWYAFFGSLWGNGNRGWPLKHFSEKEELCRKTKSLAKMDSDLFYDFACNEIEVLSDQHSNLTETYKHLHNSQKNNSLRGEILAIRKIIDSHLHLNSSSFDWEDELPIDINKHCDDKISENRVSLRTLVFYWNMWKQNVVDIFQSLRSLENEELNKYKDQIEFSLNYFGVRKQWVEGKMVYLLVNKDADWIRNNGEKGLHSDGKHLTIDITQLVSVIRSYWQSELASVGIKVLETFVTLHKSRSNGSAFHQSTSLLHMFEVSKFLLSCEHLSLTSLCKKKLHIFLGISATYFDLVFPLDWRNSVSEDLISLRETNLSINLLADIIRQSFDTKGDITYWTIGRVMMIYLTYGKQLGIDHMVVKGLQSFPAWKSFVVKYLSGGLKHAHVALELQYALEDTLKGNWKRPGYVSIHSIVYFLDSIIFFAFISSRIFFTTRSSLVGWLTQFPSTATPYTHISASNYIHEDTVYFIFELVQQILLRENCTVSWIQKSKINPTHYHPILALKLAMITSLFVLQAADDSEVPGYMLLGSKNVAHLLPPKFVSCLIKTGKDRTLNLTPDVVAEAFLSIEDPLLIVSSKDKNPRIDAPCAIFVDLRKSKEEIMNILFAKNPIIDAPCSQLLQNFGVKFTFKSGTIPEYLSSLASNTSSEADLNVMNSVSESSSTTEVHQVKNHVKEIGNECSDDGGKTQDVKNKKGKGKRNGKKGKRNIHSGQTSSNNVDVETITLKASDWEPQYLKNVAKFINVNKGESLSSSSVIALIKKHFEMNLHLWDTWIKDLKSRAGEDIRIREDLKVWEMIHSEVRWSGTENNLQAVLKKLQENGMLDLFPRTQESKGGQMAVSGSSSTTEVKETETDEEMNHAEETCDGSGVEVVLENQSGGGNTQDAQKTKKGKGKKGKKNKGRKK